MLLHAHKLDRPRVRGEHRDSCDMGGQATAPAVGTCTELGPRHTETVSAAQAPTCTLHDATRPAHHTHRHSPSSPAHLSPALAGLHTAMVAAVGVMSVTATRSPPRCQLPPRGRDEFCAWRREGKQGGFGVLACGGAYSRKRWVQERKEATEWSVVENRLEYLRTRFWALEALPYADGYPAAMHTLTM